MTPKDFQEESSQEAASGSQSAMRFLIDDPALGWRLFPLNRAMLAYRGDLRLPGYANQTVRVALAYVSTRNRKVVDLLRLQVSEWKLNSDGRVNQKTLMSGIIRKLDQNTEEHVENRNNILDKLSPPDLKAICQALKVPTIPD